MDKTLCDEFAKDRGRNPLTGRTIQPGGPTHTKLLRFCAQFARDLPAVPSPKRAPVPKPKSNNSSDCAKFLRDPTRNPKTNRPIKAGAAVHAALVRRCGGVAPPLRSHPIAPQKQKKSPRRAATGAQTRDATCQKLGLRQLSGSCWFNSSLNGFVLGGRSRKIVETLARADRTPGRFAIFSCPRVVTKSYVFSYVRRVLDDRFERTPGGRYPKNHAANLAVRLGHTPARLASGSGGDPVRAVKSILKAVFEPQTYRIFETPGEVAKIADPLVFFAAVAARPGMHYPFGVPLPLTAGAFSIDHVVMNVNFTKSDGTLSGHAVVGFFCGGKAYVYDSNRMELMKFDWFKANARRDGKALWNLLSRGGFYAGTFANAVIPYALYVRK